MLSPFCPVLCPFCPWHCGAKYLVRLSNHLTDLHGLDYISRGKWLQEAKLQPKVRVMIYPAKRSQGLRPSTSETPPSVQEEELGTWNLYSQITRLTLGGKGYNSPSLINTKRSKEIPEISTKRSTEITEISTKRRKKSSR